MYTFMKCTTWHLNRQETLYRVYIKTVCKVAYIYSQQEGVEHVTASHQCGQVDGAPGSWAHAHAHAIDARRAYHRTDPSGVGLKWP